MFLNKKLLVKWNYNKTAFLVQSPFNPNAGIWWSSEWYQESKYDGYFATGIIFDYQYQEIIYSEKGLGVEKTNLISGKELYDKFNYMKNMNKIQYLKMSMNTRKTLNNLTNDLTEFNKQFLN